MTEIKGTMLPKTFAYISLRGFSTSVLPPATLNDVTPTTIILQHLYLIASYNAHIVCLLDIQ